MKTKKMKHLTIYFILSVCVFFSCKSHSNNISSGNPEKAPGYNKDSINHIDSKGLKQGTWVDFNKDGKPMTESHYKDNYKEGVSKAFDTDGNLFNSMQFTRDTLDGECSDYGSNGKRVLVRFYIMGVLKAVKHFNSEGKLEHITLFDKDGNIIG